MTKNERKRFIGSRLRDIRETRDLSLREVSKRCGISYSQLGRIERGQNLPTLNELYKFAATYHVTRIDILNTIGMSPGIDSDVAASDHPEPAALPIIDAYCKDPKLAIKTTKKHWHTPKTSVPQGAFVVVSRDSSEDGLKRGSYALINPHYVWVSGDMYAIHLHTPSFDHILIGEVGKSIRFRDDDPTHRIGCLITGHHPHRHFYFSTDFPRKDWEVLGHVDWVVNIQPQNR